MTSPAGCVVDLRQAHNDRTDTALLEFGSGVFRSSWIHLGYRNGRIIFGGESAFGDKRESGGDNQGAVRSGDRGAKCLGGDGRLQRVFSNLEKSWLKPR